MAQRSYDKKTAELIRSLVQEDNHSFSEDSELEYGPVKVIKGKYKGRIGCYDDDEGAYAYVYWGDMVSVLDSCAKVRKSSLSGDITTYDLVNRAVYLSNEIGRKRSRLLYGSTLDDYKLITELYGEYVYVITLLNKVYEDTFYMSGNGKTKVFISHASQDREVALYIASDLKRAGYDIWFDLWDLQLGHSIPKEMGRGLESSEVLLILVSKAYHESAFCSDEWEAFYMKYNSTNRIVLPIIVDDSQMPAILGARKYYRLKDMIDYNEMLNEVLRALSKIK